MRGRLARVRVTTDEAAAFTGVSAATIRRWVAAGQLSPIQPDARHWLFHDADVTDCQYRLRSAAWHRRYAEAVVKWQAACERLTAQQSGK